MFHQSVAITPSYDIPEDSRARVSRGRFDTCGRGLNIEEMDANNIEAKQPHAKIWTKQ
jgi:hypothetical protein